MKTKTIIAVIALLFVSSANARVTMESAALLGIQEHTKITEYAAISRLNMNYYAKGVKWHYFFSKNINHIMNNIPYTGIAIVNPPYEGKTE